MASSTTNPLLHYARSHSLAQPDTYAFESISQLSKPFVIDGNAAHLPDDDGIQCDVLRALSNEKILLKIDDVAFLRAVLTSQETTASVLEALDGRRARLMILEEPVLKTDNAHDTAAFLRAARRVNGAIQLPNLEALAADVPETLGVKEHSNHTELLLIERLELSRPVLLVLKDVASSHRTMDLLDEMFLDDSKRSKMQISAPLTPPLLPMDDFGWTSDPSSSPFRPRPMTAHSSPSTADYKSLQKQLREQDQIGGFDENFLDADRNNMCDLYELQASDPRCKRPRARPRSDALHLEEPLALQRIDLPLKDLVAADGFLQVPESLKVWQQPSKRSGCEDDVNELFRMYIEPSALDAKQMLDSEKPNTPETSLKLSLPKIEEVRPHAPWSLDCRADSSVDNAAEFILSIAKLDLHHWSGTSQAERNLTWIPFPSDLGRTAAREDLEASVHPTDFLIGRNSLQAVELEGIVWKPEGFRVLDAQDEDEEELERGALEVRPQPFRNSQKRKPEWGSPTVRRTEAILEPGARSSPPQLVANDTDGKSCNNSVSTSEFFSTSMALDRYMRLMGRPTKMVKLQTSRPTAEPASHGSSRQTQNLSACEKTGSTVCTKTEVQRFKLPPQDPCSRPIIINANLMLQKEVACAFTNVNLDIELVERQYRREDQADIILSPSLGVILTSMQRIKQKPLPGQKGLAPFQQKILGCSASYERLVVVVASGNTFAIGLADPRDVHALQELIVFANALASNVEIIAVDGDLAFASKWIISLMASLPPLPQGFRILSEETLWEKFLRKAGVNPFAAQAILSELKHPERDDSASSISNSAPFGLAAFVHMQSEQRLSRFAVVMGGTRILAALNETLEASWGEYIQA